jgi:hypothetical protein
LPGLAWRVPLLRLLSFYQSFPGATVRIIRARKVIEGILVDEPGVVDFVGRDVALAAEPLDRFRVHFKATAGFQDA